MIGSASGLLRHMPHIYIYKYLFIYTYIYVYIYIIANVCNCTCCLYELAATSMVRCLRGLFDFDRGRGWRNWQFSSLGAGTPSGTGGKRCRGFTVELDAFAYRIGVGTRNVAEVHLQIRLLLICINGCFFQAGQALVHLHSLNVRVIHNRGRGSTFKPNYRGDNFPVTILDEEFVCGEPSAIYIYIHMLVLYSNGANI